MPVSLRFSLAFLAIEVFRENTMDQLLSSLAFGIFAAAMVAIFIAVHDERQGRPAESLGARFDHLLTVVRNSGG